MHNTRYALNVRLSEPSLSFSLSTLVDYLSLQPVAVQTYRKSDVYPVSQEFGLDRSRRASLKRTINAHANTAGNRYRFDSAREREKKRMPASANRVRGSTYELIKFSVTLGRPLARQIGIDREEPRRPDANPGSRACSRTIHADAQFPVQSVAPAAFAVRQTICNAIVYLAGSYFVPIFAFRSSFLRIRASN